VGYISLCSALLTVNFSGKWQLFGPELILDFYGGATYTLISAVRGLLVEIEIRYCR